MRVATATAVEYACQVGFSIVTDDRDVLSAQCIELSPQRSVVSRLQDIDVDA